jgi:HlyD family secretion protein
VDAFPGENFSGTIQQIRLSPQNVQNVITYNVVIDVKNPALKLKPGMTANLTMTIAERNNVLKVPNAALRFRPPAAETEQARERGGDGGNANQSRRQQGNEQQAGNAANGANSQSTNEGGERRDGARNRNYAGPTSAVVEGQTRRIWVLGQDNKPQPRRIKIGITDGTGTEVIEGDLKEGELVIVGQTVSGQSQPQSTQRPPGFGGGFGGGRRG